MINQTCKPEDSLKTSCKPRSCSSVGLRIAIYIRVSSDEQARYGDSMRDQRETCLDYIKSRKGAVLQDIYVDDGISGQKLNRDGFGRLLKNVKNNQVDLIIFTKLDRWFRSLRHYLNTQAVLESCQVAWIAVDQPYFDTSTPHGRAFVAQSMTWAELEAQNAGIRIRDVFENKVKYGEVISGKVPLGYKIENKHLVLSHDACAITDIFHFYFHQQSLAKTLQYMKDKYDIHMTINNLRNSILSNIKYTGRFRDNENYCPRLISDDVFFQIQQILQKNKNIKSGQKYQYLFSGLIVCDECGCRMSGCHINVVSKKKYHYHYPAYECSQYRSCKSCNNSGEIREGRIEEFLLQQILSSIEGYMVTYEIQIPEAEDNHIQKTNIQNKIDRLKQLYLNDGITLDEYLEDKEHYCRQMERLSACSASIRDCSKVEQLLNSSFITIYRSMANEEKRLFWRYMLKELRITKSCGRQRNFKAVFLHPSSH